MKILQFIKIMKENKDILKDIKKMKIGMIQQKQVLYQDIFYGKNPVYRILLNFIKINFFEINIKYL